MAWRWRKSIGRGPFRMNLTKRGVGWSVGIPGLRYGRSPSGREYISQGIPGTGLYRIEYLPKNAPNIGATPTTVPGPAPAPMNQPPPPTAGVPQPPAQQHGPMRGVAGPTVQSGSATLWLRAAGAITRFFDRLF